MGSLYHLFTAAIADFKRDKVRTALTSLGIMIGVLSVVMLIAIGLGLKNYISGQFESLGANLILVLPGSGVQGFGAGLVGGIEFDQKDVSNLRRISNLDYVVPIYFKGGNVSIANTEKSGYIMAVSEDFFGLMNTKVLGGETFGKAEVGNRAKVAVLGYSLASDLFGNPLDGIGKTVRIEGLRLKVIGIADKTGNPEHDRWVVMPYTTTYGSINPRKTLWAIYLGVPSKELIQPVTDEATQVLLRRYKKDQFSVTEQSQILSTVDQIFGVINLVLVAIGSISLLVGGVGIMNIMYATVTERTKEVGIRRAIGARKIDILMQFLMESLVLSAMGGIIGLGLAALITILVQPLFPLALNLLAVVVAFGVSSLIGVFFGVFPARRAANLSPIDAIRYE